MPSIQERVIRPIINVTDGTTLTPDRRTIFVLGSKKVNQDAELVEKYHKKK